VILAAVLGLLSAAVASRFPVAQQRAYDLAAVPSAQAARWTSAGHPTLVANLWWLRAVQYMGDDRADERGWDKLYPAVDLVTDLDPRHGYAYQVAGVMLGGAGRFAESDAIFEKGFQNVPGRYILAFQRAVNAFLYEGDYPEAARWFEAASRVPGAPAARMRAYAAAMLAKGDQHAAAVALLEESLRAAEDDDTRQSLRKQLDQVELEYRATVVEKAAAAYAARHGFPPAVLQLLVLEGLLPEIPADPFGGMLYLDADGRVRSTVHQRRFERPSTPAERSQHLDSLKQQTRDLEKKNR
jgi:tetratricopeptide (TPR) repeat protein